MKKNSFYLPALDGLRFLAFIFVFMSHLPPMPSTCHPMIIHLALSIQKIGWIGVDLFLCLSAYLIFCLLQQEYDLTGWVSIKNFWMRRILRIWPLYFLCLALGFALLPFSRYSLSFSDPAYQDAVRTHLIPHLLFLGNWSTAFGNFIPGPLSPLWTISLEEQLYVLLPILFLLSVKRPRWFLIFLTAGFLGSMMFRALSIWMGLKYPFIWTSTLTRLEPFILGILIAFYSEFIKKAWPGKSGFLMIPCLTLALMLSPTIISNSLYSVWQLCASAVIVSFMLVFSLRSNMVKKILSLKILRQGGKISYGLYVFHVFCISVVFSNLKPFSFWDWIRNVILSGAFVFLLSTSSYYFFERPILKLKSRYSSIKSGAL